MLFEEEDKYVRIIYKEEPEHFIELQAENEQQLIPGVGASSRQVLYCETSPGDFSQIDRSRLSNFTDFLRSLNEWLVRLKAEVLLSNPFHRKLEEFQADVNRRIEEHVKDAGSHFTEGEKEVLKAQLQELSEKISSLENVGKDSAEQLKKLDSMLRDLARAASVMPKGSWLRTACNNLFAYSVRVASSEEGQKIIAQTVQHLLDDSPKHG